MNDGGPAFPQGTDSNDSTATGMSLRDWFAGKALVGMMSADPEWARLCRTDRPSSAEDFAKCAYEQADAMIAARENKP